MSIGSCVLESGCATPPSPVRDVSYPPVFHERGRILIADDEEQIRGLLSKWLQREGYVCDGVGTAAEAAAAVETNVYDLLVTDIHMPGNASLEFLRACRAGATGVPVIVMTGYPTVETSVQAIRLSAVDYLIKPVNRQVLLDCVALAAGKGQVLRALRTARDEARVWMDALACLEQSVTTVGETRAEGSGLTRQAFDQTVRLFQHIATSLKATLEAMKRGDGGSVDVCAVLHCRRGAVYEEALRGAIEVLINTKGAFKSKELGDLRKSLTEVLKREG